MAGALAGGREIKVAVIGGGGSYTPEIVEGFLDRGDLLPRVQLRLHDIDRGRLSVMAGLSRRMIARSGGGIQVIESADGAAAVDGADFVITQIRVGGMAARALDEKIPLELDVIGQETTGPGGMFKALRTIPPMIEFARDVEKRAPSAWILNYTNPSGLVTEAVTRHTNARFVGLCSGMPGIVRRAREKLGDAGSDLLLRCVGLNHLGFLYRAERGGADVMDEVIEAMSGDDAEWNELVRLLRAVPIAYLRYYYDAENRLAQLKSQEKSRAEEIMEIEKELFAAAADERVDTKPEPLRRRGGGGYSNVTLDVMAAILGDSGRECVVSLPNHGLPQTGTRTVVEMAGDSVVEASCRVGADRLEPLPVGELPLAFRGLVLAVKAYEELAVEAAVTGDPQTAIRALLAHPLVPTYAKAKELFRRLYEAHQDYLPQFKSGS